MEKNYREKNRYYRDRDNYEDYPRNKDKYKYRNYRMNNEYRNRDMEKDSYRKRDIYDYRERERSRKRDEHRDNKYKERDKDIYDDYYYDKYKERDDDYDDRKSDKYDSYRKYSRSRSINKEKDYYKERNKMINLLEGRKYNDKYKYKYKRRDDNNWRKRSSRRSSSSTSTIKKDHINNDKENDKEKEKEKEPFVSAFTNFPFQLPEEITKNENYQKLYNNNNNNLNNNVSNNPNNNNSLLNNQSNTFTTVQNPINRPSIISDPQFSLYTNPYLVQSLALLPTAQNTDKKLYIGNLPNGMTSPSLVKMLNIALLTLKPEDFAPGEPVISSWVSPDGHYAFVEFRTAEEATKGFILNGFKIMGVPLKVGRPKTYQGLPQNVEETGPSNTVAAILMKSKKNVQVKTYKFVMPTKVLCLNSIIKGLDIEDEDKYNEVAEDIKTECEKYGKVLDIFMPRKDVEDNATPGMGNAYVMFENVEQSKLARKFLSLKRFNNKLIYIQYIPEDNFINKEFEPII